jgi:hypothetical protein
VPQYGHRQKNKHQEGKSMQLSLNYEANKNQFCEIVKDAIEAILGVSFNHGYPYRCNGISFIAYAKHRGRTWNKTEKSWEGVLVEFWFLDSSHHKVRRSLLIKPDGKIDEKKIKAKWDELIQLKKDEDQYSERKRRKDENDQLKRKELSLQLQSLGVTTEGLSAKMHVKPSGICLELDKLTPNQTRQILDILRD